MIGWMTAYSVSRPPGARTMRTFSRPERSVHGVVPSSAGDDDAET